MRFNNAQFKYSNTGENSIEFEPKCAQCIINKHLLRCLADEHLRFIESYVRLGRRRNLFRRSRACYSLADGSISAPLAECPSLCRFVVSVHYPVGATRSSVKSVPGSVAIALSLRNRFDSVPSALGSVRCGFLSTQKSVDAHALIARLGSVA